MNQGEQDRKISQLIAKCWADEGFKQKLLADPAATVPGGGRNGAATFTSRQIRCTKRVAP